MREAEQTAAGEALGVKECIYLRYPDGFLEHDAELRGRIVRLIRRYRPDTVITWDGFRPGFNHRDHRAIGIATYDALFPAVRDPLYYPDDESDGRAIEPVDEALHVECPAVDGKRHGRGITERYLHVPVREPGSAVPFRTHEIPHLSPQALALRLDCAVSSEGVLAEELEEACIRGLVGDAPPLGERTLPAAERLSVSAKETLDDTVDERTVVRLLDLAQRQPLLARLEGEDAVE